MNSLGENSRRKVAAVDAQGSTSGDRPPGGRRQGALTGRPWPERRKEIFDLFVSIAARYDRLNRILSLGLDQGWRRWAARSLRDAPRGLRLDLASGTGDLAVALAAHSPSSPRSASEAESRSHPAGADGSGVIRADLAADLLHVGDRKVPGSPALVCEMDLLPLRSGSVSAIGQGFALRHSRDQRVLFRELARVLVPGGRIAIIDMRYPGGGGAAALYRFYFRAVLPRLAGLLGGERDAYDLMVASVRSLPDEAWLLLALEEAGFIDVVSRPGIFGSVRLLEARMPFPPTEAMNNDLA